MVVTGCYVNKKCNYPVTRFRNISCILPGSSHDASALKASKLYNNAHELIPQGNIVINGTPVPFLILGDPAYPLLPWLIKPFIHNSRITQEQVYFNECLSSGRVVVEHAFGRLKSRWRILLKRTDVYYKFVPTLVATACMLHNFCEENNERINPRWATDNTCQQMFPQPTRQAQVGSRDECIRNVLCSYVAARRAH
ncbi:uncharacterized protein LOC135369088 [Ornithodoros turicata]|uniref:uncharacterized protein LOC135369088 n=1 Tax=Ornithodoros turicata TaxID=34597 RepID=UPI003138EDA6